MPNHIKSTVAIIAPTKKEIKKLIKQTNFKLTQGDNTFDFNGIIPMPKSLNITSGTNTDLGIACFSDKEFNKYKSYGWFDERYNTPKNRNQLMKELSKTDEGKESIRLGRKAIRNIEKYGYKDWYDWSIANWGTKWNAYDVIYLGHSDRAILLQISTAWGSPYGVWEELENRGYTVKGVVHGEMEGYEYIGSSSDNPFVAYEKVEVEYDDWEQDKALKDMKLADDYYSLVNN